MNRFAIATGIIVGAVALAAWLGSAGIAPGPPSPAPSPIPAPVGGPDILRVLAKNPDKAQAQKHAEYLQRIGERCAKCIEADGRVSAPRIKTGGNAASYRRDLRLWLMDGESFTPQYPDLAPLLGGYLDQAVGKTDGPLSADDRQRWVAAMKVIGNNAAYAKQELGK